MDALKSKTTWTVAGSTATGGAAIVTLLTLARSIWPGKVPWEEAADPEVVALLSTLVVPTLSRLVARLRGKL
jgi:hypothetical protein